MNPITPQDPNHGLDHFERPALTVDVVLLGVSEDSLWTVLVRRAEPPFAGKWTLPGGFVRLHESLDEAVERVLSTKVGLGDVFFEQLYTFGELDRDPRTRVVSVAHYALVDPGRFETIAESAAGHRGIARIEVPWEGETGGPVEVRDAEDRALALGFDHEGILGVAVKRLRGKLNYTPVGYQLLPERFTLLQLQRVHETVLGRPLNKDSFRRRMLASGDLEATGRRQRDVGHRPAELYRFRRRSAI